MTRFRVGVDIGGTFTDIVLLDADGRLHTKKVSSSVDDYARAIVEGVGEVFRETGLVGADVAEVLHGTTVASNAILELRGAKTGLITTEGFRDILEIRRLRMPRLYDLTWEKPAPLVERYLRVEVQERINARGEVQAPLDPVDVERVLDRLLGEGIEALAVCLLNSYANPVHEERIKEIVARRAPGLVTCISAEVLPEIREYERTSTTVINAYVMPIVRSYLATLRSGLDDIGVKAPLLIMQSNGGLMTDAAAAQKPIHVIESGPAAGVVGAQVLAQRLDLGKLISFDMGGTTAKAALVEDGDVSRAAEYQVGGGIVHGSRLLTGAGYLLRVPAIDLAEVGAGGGSLVWIDAGGALQVGPRSAGASPGPLCYDLGGTEPTITDANVILGYLNPTRLAGGAVKLNAARAHQVFEEKVARPLGQPLAEAAHGAHLIAASNMMRAIRAVSSERGHDPREYALFAFGRLPLPGSVVRADCPGDRGLRRPEHRCRSGGGFRAGARADVRAQGRARRARRDREPPRRRPGPPRPAEGAGTTQDRPARRRRSSDAARVLRSRPRLAGDAHPRPPGPRHTARRPVHHRGVRRHLRGAPWRPGRAGRLRQHHDRAGPGDLSGEEIVDGDGAPRSDRLRAVQEHAPVDRRRDGPDHPAHRVLRRAQGQHGLLDRLLRRRGTDRHAGAHAARPPLLVPRRVGRHHPALRRPHAPGRRVLPERSVRGRHAHPRRLRSQAHLPRGEAAGLRRDHLPPDRHGGSGRWLQRLGLHRDLPGGPAHPAREDVRQGRAERDALSTDREERPPAGAGLRRPPRPARRVSHRRGGVSPARRAPGRQAGQGLHGGDPGLHRAPDAGGASPATRRRVVVRGLDRRRRRRLRQAHPTLRDVAEDGRSPGGRLDRHLAPGQGRHQQHALLHQGRHVYVPQVRPLP